MVLNGINYTEKQLTDEEMAVINAMRSDGCVQLHFHDISYKNTAKWLDACGELKHGKVEIHDIADLVAFHVQYNGFAATYYVYK